MSLKLLPLSLQANFEGIALFLRRKDDPSFADLRQKVLVRDAHTCRFCGFHAERYQQIVCIDGNYHNNDINNLATACVFCMQCQMLGMRNTNAKIIYLPEMTQIELTHFVRILFCASLMRQEISDLAKSLYQSLRKRTSPVEEVFGENASDSMVFAQSLVDIAPDTKKHQQKAMAALRLLPAKSYYNRQIEYWTNAIITPAKIEAAIRNYNHKLHEATSL